MSIYALFDDLLGLEKMFASAIILDNYFLMKIIARYLQSTAF